MNYLSWSSEYLDISIILILSFEVIPSLFHQTKMLVIFLPFCQNSRRTICFNLNVLFGIRSWRAQSKVSGSMFLDHGKESVMIGGWTRGIYTHGSQEKRRWWEEPRITCPSWGLCVPAKACLLCFYCILKQSHQLGPKYSHKCLWDTLHIENGTQRFYLLL